MNNECEPLSQDDREIISDLLFPIFEEAGENNQHVTRDKIRQSLSNIFPWPHISEVLRELENKEYVLTISTRGGGVFIPGDVFYLWAEEMKPIEYGEEKEAAALTKSASLLLSEPEAKKLLDLLTQAAEGNSEAREKILAALAAGHPVTDTLKILTH